MPKFLKLLLESKSHGLVVYDNNVLTVLLGGPDCPIEAASENHCPVNGCELVMHMATMTSVVTHRKPRESQSLRVCALALRLHVVNNHANLDAPLVAPNYSICQPIIREGKHGYIEFFLAAIQKGKNAHQANALGVRKKETLNRHHFSSATAPATSRWHHCICKSSFRWRSVHRLSS